MSIAKEGSLALWTYYTLVKIIDSIQFNFYWEVIATSFDNVFGNFFSKSDCIPSRKKIENTQQRLTTPHGKRIAAEGLDQDNM